ncbi:MAG: dihydroorotase [Candidatus Neomarinimicrobiota bacterium]
MIDPHVHLRDGEQRYKESIRHGLAVAEKLGLAAVFDMPNTSPPILDRASILARLDRAKEANSSVFYGLYGGLTKDPEQIKEAVACTREFEQVVGLKLFAGKSTGDLSIPDTVSQKLVFDSLAKKNYTGLLAIHCENEADFIPGLWDPARPISHCEARPPLAELNSISKMIYLAKITGFKGTLHVAHISLPESIELLEQARESINFTLSCGVTPHHLLLHDNMMKKSDGLLLKMNPPLRSQNAQKALLKMLLEERINWVESDHAPHLRSEKLNPPYASGIPGLPILPKLIAILKSKGASPELLDRITHLNICKTYGLDIKNRPIIDIELFNEYEFNAYEKI